VPHHEALSNCFDHVLCLLWGTIQLFHSYTSEAHKWGIMQLLNFVVYLPVRHYPIDPIVYCASPRGTSHCLRITDSFFLGGGGSTEHVCIQICDITLCAKTQQCSIISSVWGYVFTHPQQKEQKLEFIRLIQIWPTSCVFTEALRDSNMEILSAKISGLFYFEL
jgi:hypothetical protein